MRVTDLSSAALRRVRALLVAFSMGTVGCTAPEPRLSFIDDASGLSFVHPPRWSVGFAEQNGLRYRYVVAPKVGDDKEGLSITLIPATEGASAEAVAQPYLAGATNVVPTAGDPGISLWTFKDSSGVPSRLRLAAGPVSGTYFGGWVRGSEAAFKEHGARLDEVLGSLRTEASAQWQEEKFGGMSVRVPASWTRMTRLSNATNASMQFKTLPLDVEKGTSTVHGFVTLSKEPVPPPGDLAAFNRMLKERASDTMTLVEHKPWPALAATAAPGEAPQGFVDFLRSGNTIAATRVRRYITVKSGAGIVLSCEARSDAFERLDPWCRRLAETARLD